MIRTTAHFLFAITVAGFASDRFVFAQSDSPLTRMRPIGSGSAVDQFRGESSDIRPAGFTAGQFEGSSQTSQAPVRQTVWMQSGFAAPDLGPSGMSLPTNPPTSLLPTPSANATIPNTQPFPTVGAPVQPVQPVQPMNPGGRSLPMAPITASGLPGNSFVPSSSDQSPIPQPQLGTNANAFANMDNCNLITGPSPYMAASGFGSGCGQVVPTTYAGPVTQAPGVAPGSLPAEIPSPAMVAPVTVLPPVAVQPPAVPAKVAPARALVSMGQDKYPVQVGQGLWGQPVAYVPRQRVRNWFRYIFP